MGDTKTSTKTDSNQGVGNLKVQQLLKAMVDQGASDLHLVAGSPPALRISGEMHKVKVGLLNGDDSRKLIYQILTESQIAEFEKNLELDFSFGVRGLARFRGNVFYSKGAVSGVFRQIPSQIPAFETLGLPKVIMDMTDVSNGLILITGPTGSGKSTTLAAIIDRLNQNERGHIITLEDPIEFVHNHKGCVINQREIGSDTNSFKNGLKSLLRQDPDIVLVGELRDRETIEAALEIAETGHLVFGTLHTNSTIQTINRIINVFPSDQQSQIRTLLSFVLQGVVAQQLVPSPTKGRALTQEILRNTPAIRNLIRENKIHQIYSQMQVGQDKSGMVTMNQQLVKHLQEGTIDEVSALSYSNNQDEIAKMLGLKKD